MIGRVYAIHSRPKLGLLESNPIGHRRRWKINLKYVCLYTRSYETIVSLGRKAVCLLQIQHAESYANLICVRLRMFITCKEIPRRALSVFSQERQRVAFQAKVCEIEERKERE